MTPLQVLIIDDKTEFRLACGQLLSTDLDISVADSDGCSSLEQLQLVSPDVAVLGLNINDQHRLQLLKLIRLRLPSCQVLALADNHSDEDAVKHIEASAAGFMNSEDLERLLAKAVKKINEGEAWVPRKLVPSLVERLRVLA